MWSKVRFALRNLLHKRKIESNLDAEIRSYVDAVTDEKIASGLSHEEARRRALAESGGMEQVKQAVRNGRAGMFAESLGQDICYGLRQLRRNPAFTWTAVITLGLGIGATTAIFSAVYALMLRPLPYPDANRLMYISQAWPKRNADSMPMISPDFVAAQSTLKSFQSFAGFVDMGGRNLTGTGDPVRARVVEMTANFLPMLGIVPRPGRNFLSSEDRAGGPAVVLLSHRLWESKFQGDPSVVGRAVTLDGKIQTVVGVLPAHFLFPDPAIEPDVYVPADFDSDATLSRQKFIYMVSTTARLRDGVTAQQAQAELQTFAENRAKGYPADLGPFADGRRMGIEPLQRHLTGDDRKNLLLMLACVGAVLLIACANVANLQLARATSRRHETAVRGALGAARRRLVRQFLVESLMLATLATAVGLGIALAATWLIRQGGMPGELAGTSKMAQLIRTPFGKLSAAVQVDSGVLLFAGGLALLTTVLFGLAPAISGSRTNLRTALQGAALRMSSGREQRLLRHGLLIAEIGLGVVLLAAAGLLIRSFANVLHNDSGFDASQSLTGVVQLQGGTPSAAVKGFVDQLLPRLRAIPGVRTAAVTSALALDKMNFCPNTMIVFGEGPLPPPLERQGGCVISITPDYFQAAGTLVLKGRSFNDRDNVTSVPVAIVNQAFARLYFKGDVLGKQFRTNILAKNHDTEFLHRTIVGIVQDVRYNSLEDNVQPAIYLPMDQVPLPRINLLLRSDVEPASLASAMRRAVTATDAEQPLFDMQTMDERVADTAAPRRLMMLLTACFAMLAVVLSGVGVYGVFAYSVSQRTQEMGIRLALGASRARVMRLVSMQAMRLILAGGAMGIAAAWFLDRLLASMLVGVKPHDPVSLSLAWALMTLIALLGSSLPAMSASRVDLVSVLHSE
jgi:putative ABC transport system permease protein